MKKLEFPTLPARIKQVRAIVKGFNSSTGSDLEFGCYSQRDSLESDSGLATSDCWVAIDLEGEPSDIKAFSETLYAQGWFTNENWFQVNPYHRLGDPYEIRLKFNSVQD